MVDAQREKVLALKGENRLFERECCHSKRETRLSKRGLSRSEREYWLSERDCSRSERERRRFEGESLLPEREDWRFESEIPATKPQLSCYGREISIRARAGRIFPKLIRRRHRGLLRCRSRCRGRCWRFSDFASEALAEGV